MPGNHIHILEELKLPGGSMDGIKNDRLGYIICGGREIEPYFEVLWDLFRSIPSLENPDHSILDEFTGSTKKTLVTLKHVLFMTVAKLFQMMTS